MVNTTTAPPIFEKETIQLFDELFGKKWQRIDSAHLAQLDSLVSSYFGRKINLKQNEYLTRTEKGVIELKTKSNNLGYVFCTGLSYEAEMVTLRRACNSDGKQIVDVRIRPLEKTAAFAWKEKGVEYG